MSNEAAMIAIGVGCRSGCPATVIQDLVRRALDSWRLRPDRAINRLFTIIDKRQEAGLHKAAEELGYELSFLPREMLREVAPRVQNRSAVALALFGVESVAEAAALAGAGPDAVLVVPRISAPGATCAVASVLTPLQKVLSEAEGGCP